MKLLTTSNYKTSKSLELGYLTGILHLAPSTKSGYNVCPKASKGCAEACLNTSGHGRFEATQTARIRKTVQYYTERDAFVSQLRKDIEALKRKAVRENLRPAVRINGTSDLPNLAIQMANEFPEVQFYDYTKILRTFKLRPANYHLTFSRSEENLEKCLEAMSKGYNVAMVFDVLPDSYLGKTVINGDEHDLRFLDPRGVIVGLTEKADAKVDKYGFVIRQAA